MTETDWEKVYEILNKLHTDYIDVFLGRENIDVIVSKSFAKASKEKALENHFVQAISSVIEDVEGFRIIQQPSYPVNAEKKIGDFALSFNGEIIAFYEFKELYTLHNVNQSPTKRLQGIVKDVRSLIKVKEAFPMCPCFIIILDVGDRYLYKNLESEIYHIRPRVALKGEWHKPSIRVAFGIFEIDVNPPEPVPDERSPLDKLLNPKRNQ